jgi:hypothetical protein
MTRIEALESLLAKVEAGTLSGAPEDRDLTERAVGKSWMQLGLAYTQNSIDAAMDLHKAVIHERVVIEVKYSLRYNGVVRLWDMNKFVSEGESDSIARAWLIAILRALIAQERG